MGCGVSTEQPTREQESDSRPELSRSPVPSAEIRRGSFVSPEHVPEMPRSARSNQLKMNSIRHEKIGTLSSHGLKPGFDGKANDKINQDRGLITYPFNEDKQAALLCVYDGHGVYGELVSEFVMWKVQESLLAASERLYRDTEALLIQSFEEADRHLKLTEIDSMVSGSTAVAVLALKDVLVRFSVLNQSFLSVHLDHLVL